MSTRIQYRRFLEYVVYTASNSLRLLSSLRVVDLTMNASMDLNTNDGAEYSISPSEDATNLGDEERGLASRSTRISPLTITSRTSSASNAEETELQTRRRSESIVGSIKRKTSQLLEAVTPSTSTGDPAPVNPKLAELLDAYARSDIASRIREEGEALRRAHLNRQAESGASAEVDPSQQLPDVAEETTLLRGRKGASWGTQFRILSGRAFKNLYRDPALLTAHYLASIVLAGESGDCCCLELVLMNPLHTYTVMCGLFFRHVT